MRLEIASRRLLDVLDPRTRGRRLLQKILSGEQMGPALRTIRVEAARQRNLLGLAYTLFGAADAALAGPVIRQETP